MLLIPNDKEIFLKFKYYKKENDELKIENQRLKNEIKKLNIIIYGLKNRKKTNQIINNEKLNDESKYKTLLDKIQKLNIEQNDKDLDKHINNVKVKHSTTIICRIKNFYYENDKLIINYNNPEVDNLKYQINNNYEIINLNKSKNIYNHYMIYKKYLEAKEKYNKLTFLNFIEYNTEGIGRFTEKVKRCYIFFNDLLNIIKDIPNYFESSNIDVLIDILKRCRLSVDKLYKIRGEDYKELIAFLSPIIIKTCNAKYEKNKD